MFPGGSRLRHCAGHCTRRVKRYAQVQASLGRALLWRFEAPEQEADLDGAIAAFGQAPGAAQGGSPDWDRWQASLGAALLRCFEALGQRADLEGAIATFGQALEAVQEGSPDWAESLCL